MKITASELDDLYTSLCKTMTQIGEAQSQLFLARFALLAIAEIGDAEVVHRLTSDASESLLRSKPADSPPALQTV